MIRRMITHTAFLLVSVLFILTGCRGGAVHEENEQAVKAAILRYNQLVAEGYRKQNMNLLQEVTTTDQATKHYFHMSALGEGKLRMDSILKKIEFTTIVFPTSSEATVETSETWDFTQYDMKSGKKFYEETDYIYVMGYTLKNDGSRWVITNVNTIAGTSTNTPVPQPKIDRKGNIIKSSNDTK